MISYEEALARILRHARPLPCARVRLEDALGYYLAENIRAREPVPLFDQSAMDGFGVRAPDVAQARAYSPARLKLAGMVRAGDDARRPVRSGTAVRIFTGAKVPPGVQAVVVQESCEETGGEVLVRESVPAGKNIRRKGEEIRRGARVLSAGTRITPPVIGLLATLGYSTFLVHRKPRVALLVTGNELVALGKPLRPGRIRDSNSHALAAALKDTGIGEVSVRRIKDDEPSLRQALMAALQDSDFVITSGGVSVGEYDLVKDAAVSAGVRTVFWKVAMKPGMPNYFGVWERGRGRGKGVGKGAGKSAAPAKTLLFGLPGNPVSALVSYHQFVRHALLKMSGQRTPGRFVFPAALEKDVSKKAGRAEFVRGVVRVNNRALNAAPTDQQGSHMLSGLASANCLIHLGSDATLVEHGQQVAVEFLSWEMHG
jgi:molybdopterin molybdotransferase